MLLLYHMILNKLIEKSTRTNYIPVLYLLVSLLTALLRLVLPEALKLLRILSWEMLIVRLLSAFVHISSRFL